MITRIVKMTFRREETGAFIDLFESVKLKIRHMPGCRGVLLLQDNRNPEIMFTYSHWDSEADLNAYRDSPLFATTWADTKSKFASAAEAWSLHEISRTENNI